MSLSVIICSHDRPAFLQESVRRALAVAPSVELVVVDSASPAGVISAAAGELGVTVVRAERPGLSIARNAGVAASHCDIVAFTDDDCLIDEGWVSALGSTFSDPAVGVATGRVVPDSESTFVTSVEVREESFDFDSAHDPFDVGHGANLAFRRSALEQAGIFDPLLGAGARWRAAEDTDMVWRVLRQGLRGRFDAGSLVTHRQWRTTAQAIRMAYGYGLGAGAFTAKARRLDPSAVWPRQPMARAGASLQTAMKHLRSGYQSGALAELQAAAGVLVGYRQARACTLAGPVFATDPRWG